VDRLGTQYAVPLSAWRAGAVSAAGATVAIVSAPTWVRVLATSEGRTSITTTLPAPWDAFDLPARGFETIQTETDFLLSADQPVAVATFGASQQVTGIPSALPAGAPTFAMVPLPDRFETEVVVAVPEGFPFDFVTILGGEALPLWDRGPFPMDCDSSAIEDDLFVHRCQVSFPEILEDQLDPITGEAPWIQSAVQADGVHGIEAEEPFGIVLEGFGKNAAYALPGS
jgi:hypothetical protein